MPAGCLPPRGLPLRRGLLLLILAGSACSDATGPDQTANSNIVALAVGDDHGCLLTISGDAWCWGSGRFGQLGSGDTADHTTPQKVVGGLAFTQLAGGSSHTCGLAGSGAAYCWGANATGALGDGGVVFRSVVPVAVTGGLHFTRLSAGTGFTCGLDPQGHAWCWGSGLQGELGDGSSTDQPAPVAVAGGHVFTEITTGLFHTCGLDPQRQAWCWGNNLYGQLGTGDLNSRAVPTLVEGPRRFVRIGAGSFHTCGLGLDHRAYCWGSNITFELGNGSSTTTYALAPGTVAIDLTFAGLSVGAHHACAWTGDGELYCWGASTYGKLGYGSAVATTRPVAVTGGDRFRDAEAGSNHTCALTVTGEPACWGWNRFGQLGNGSRSNSPDPVAINTQDIVPLP